MEVKILLDSLNPYNETRLTTFYLVYPQICHQHILTHRMFSRNAMSLRAISTSRVRDFNLVYPTWTLERKGMQGDEAGTDVALVANQLLEEMYEANLYYAKALTELGIHHQNVNEYLRPFINIHVILSATDLDNFFNLRCSKETKPDTRILAEKMKAALEESQPTYRYKHIPLAETFDNDDLTEYDINLISAARLARYSYMKWTDDIEKDKVLGKRLMMDKHASPFEHIAYASEEQKYFANFFCWVQWRKILAL